MRAYAVENEIDVHSFYGAKKRLVQQGVLSGSKGHGFVRAQLADHTGGYRVQFPNVIAVTSEDGHDSEATPLVRLSSGHVVGRGRNLDRLPRVVDKSRE